MDKRIKKQCEINSRCEISERVGLFFFGSKKL